MKSIRIKVGERKRHSIESIEVELYRKTKYVYQILDLNDKLIAKGESLPKAIGKAETILKQKTKKKNSSIKFLTMDLIIADKDDDYIIAEVKKEHPDSKFDKRHISWYRSTMYRDGIIGPEHAPRNSRAHKSWKSKQENLVEA